MMQLTPVTTPKNADLYQAGQQYTAYQVRLTTRSKKKATWKAVAAEYGTDRKSVMTAAGFADAVDRIAATCGDKSKVILLAAHPKPSARVVMKISRTHAERQRFALRQVRAGRDPLGKPPPGVDPPFDTHNPAEVLSRLARNAGAVDRAADGLRDTPAARWPSAVTLAAMLGHAKDIRRHVRSMKRQVAAVAVAPSGGEKRGEKKLPRLRCGHKAAAFDPKRALSPVALAAGVTRKNDRDLPRVLAETPPSAAERAAMLTRLDQLDAAAARLVTVVRAGPHDPSTGPAEVAGTYVVLFRLAQPVTGLQVGALGTFDFPAGYYAYLGSAFGGGGVRKRTHRHLTADTPRRWNLDHLKPLCTPVAVWWTHDRAKVEFAWADILGAMPGASFPAPRFGAADNAKAKAHLVRFARKPSVAEFRRRVTAAISGHAPVHERRVEGWTGRGWPD